MSDHSRKMVGLNEIFVDDRIMFESWTAGGFQCAFTVSMKFDLNVIADVLDCLPVHTVSLKRKSFLALILHIRYQNK